MCNEYYTAIKIREEQIKIKLAEALKNDKSHTRTLSENEK